MGKGMYSLLATVIRTIVLTVPLAWLFAVLLGWGLIGVWWGLVLANIIGGAFTFLLAKIYVDKLLKTPVSDG